MSEAKSHRAKVMRAKAAEVLPADRPTLIKTLMRDASDKQSLARALQQLERKGSRPPRNQPKELPR